MQIEIETINRIHTSSLGRGSGINIDFDLNPYQAKSLFLQLHEHYQGEQFNNWCQEVSIQSNNKHSIT